MGRHHHERSAISLQPACSNQRRACQGGGEGKAKKEESKKPTNGCEEGEVLAEDGHCYFEGELVKLRNHHKRDKQFV